MFLINHNDGGGVENLGQKLSGYEGTERGGLIRLKVCVGLVVLREKRGGGVEGDMGLVGRASEYIPELNKSVLGNQLNSGPNTPIRRTEDSAHIDSVSLGALTVSRGLGRKSISSVAFSACGPCTSPPSTGLGRGAREIQEKGLQAA